MRGEERGSDPGAVPHPEMPRVVPDTHFAQNLGHEIRQAAQARSISGGGSALADVVVELRTLVRLLRKTLVPVQPQASFAWTLGEQLQAKAQELDAARQQRWRWVMVGGVVGSLVSLFGVVAALLAHRRNGQAKKSTSAL